jgi:hypothetical protein
MRLTTRVVPCGSFILGSLDDVYDNQTSTGWRDAEVSAESATGAGEDSSNYDALKFPSVFRFNGPLVLWSFGLADKQPGNRRTVRLDQLMPALAADELSDEDREGLGAIHPSFMGGEYLPGYRREEVEIVRIELDSVTSDVISLRARPIGRTRPQIAYSLVDEYQTEYGIRPVRTCHRRSENPINSPV